MGGEVSQESVHDRIVEVPPGGHPCNRPPGSGRPLRSRPDSHRLHD
jgi:hypothetical protein